MKRLIDKMVIVNLVFLIAILLLLGGCCVILVDPSLITDKSYAKYISFGILAFLLFVLLKLLKGRRGLLSANDRLNRDGDKMLTSETPPRHAEFRSGRLYCGEEAFYSGKDGVLLFYDEILWIYKSLDKVTGISVGESNNFCTRDGRVVRIRMSEKDLNALINKYIYPAQPQLIVGYSPLNLSEYERRRSQRKGRR